MLGESGGAVADEADDGGEGGVVAQGEVVVAFDVVFLADGGEGFGLFDGVDAQVGFEVEFEVEHLGRIAGLFGDDGEDLLDDRVDAGAAAAGRSPAGLTPQGSDPRQRSAAQEQRRGGVRGVRWRGRGRSRRRGEGGVVAQGEVVVAFDVVFLADGGERFGLFDGVDPQVGFEVEFEVEHLGRIAGLLGHDGQHLLDDRIDAGAAAAGGRSPAGLTPAGLPR